MIDPTDPGRSVSPEQTLQRLRPFQAAMGITRLADLTGLDRIGIPVFAAIRPNSRSVVTSQGKGLSPDSARVAALMEAAETWHAERVELPLRFAAAAELHEPLVDLAGLPTRQDRDFDPGQPILWVQGDNLRQSSKVWVPYEVVHTDYRHPEPPTAGCFHQSTNGLAAGNSRDEAIRHALCELIERDCLARWRPTDRLTRIDLSRAGLGMSALGTVAARLEESGFDFGLFDIAGRLGVPTYLAVLVDRLVPGSHPGLGTACHPIAAVAATKALLEAVQVRTSYIAGAWDEFTPAEFAPTGVARKQAWSQGMLARTADVAPLPTGDSRHRHDHSTALRGLLDQLSMEGLDEIIVVDLARAEIGLPVVRVIVPGLAFADVHGNAVNSPPRAGP